jgi:hypothetical protein
MVALPEQPGIVGRRRCKLYRRGRESAGARANRRSVTESVLDRKDAKVKSMTH